MVKRLAGTNQNTTPLVNVPTPTADTDAANKAYVDNAVLGATPVSIDGSRIGGIIYIGHRGAPNVYPEHSMEGYRAVVAAGAKFLEQDVHLLIDGGLGIMHDATLTRTTTSDANSADQTSASWKALTLDIGSVLGGLYAGKTYTPVLFDEVVREFGNKVVLTPEIKSGGQAATTRVMEVLEQYNVAKDSVIIQSFTQSDLTPAIAAGYHTLLLGAAINPTTAVAAGVEFAGVPSSASQSYIQSLTTAGLEVIVYTINRQYERDKFIGWGVTGFFSDDIIYLSDQHRITKDPFGSQTWYHGHLADAVSNNRGSFVSPDRLQLATGDRNYVLQGWASPIGGDKNNNSYTVQFSLRFSAMTATRWAGVAIFNQDTPWDDNQNPVTGQNGYHFLFRTEGNVQIYKVTNGTATLLVDVAGAAAALNTTYNFTLTVTPTGITFGRSGASQASTNDTSYRGGYLYFSERVNTVQFFDVTITDN